MDHVKSVNAYTMLSPNVIQEGENWAASVSESFARMKATCKDIAERFEGDAQYAQLRKELSQYSQSLATMRMAYEYLASMSIIVQRNSNCFSHGGELYWPHETLKTGYSSARHRRIALSHLEIMLRHRAPNIC